MLFEQKYGSSWTNKQLMWMTPAFKIFSLAYLNDLIRTQVTSVTL